MYRVPIVERRGVLRGAERHGPSRLLDGALDKVAPEIAEPREVPLEIG